jgi:tetratricopeptide (TPR) repeat protein
LLAADLAFGDDKHAAATVERVRKLAPDRLKGQPEAQVVEGKLLLAQGKLQEALTQFTAASTALDAAKASSRRLAQPRFGAAVAKSQLAAGAKAPIRDALDELDLAIKYDPSLYPAYLFRAALLQDNKRTPGEALTVARHGAELAPENADAWALGGQLAVKVGDRKTLALAIEKLGAIAPSSEALKELQHH